MQKEDEIISLRREIGRLSRLLQIGRSLSRNLEIDNLMGKIVEDCAIMVNAQRAFMFILDKNTNVLWTTIFPSGKTIRLDQDEGLEGWVSAYREFIISNNPHEDSRFSDRMEREIGFPINNLVVLPLLNYRGESIGVLEVINKKKGHFNSQDYLLLQAVSAQLSMGIENARLYNDLKRTFSSLIEVMAKTIDAKHPVSKGHSVRVAEYAVGIAKEMGLPEKEIEQIRIASLVHDYGKIGIDDAILKKTGKLSLKEFEAMKEHARLTHDIVSKVHFTEDLSDVPTIASCHHERWDGKGYPFGMAREAIPLGSRIIALADTFDAITTEREYKESKSVAIAFKEILAESGTHFDPLVVDAFERYYQKVIKPRVAKGKFDLPDEEENRIS